jgi:hypothetical protein
MGALIFVIIVAAVVITLVVGVQKRKKVKKEEGVYYASDPNFQPPVEAHIEFNSEEPIATPEQQEELVKAKKELKVKKPASKPKLAAEPVKRSRTKK